MKKLLLLIFFSSGLICNSFAQHQVYDHTSRIAQALEHAENLAKQAEQIEKQVQQILKIQEGNDLINTTNSILGQYGYNSNINLSKLSNTYKTFSNIGDVDSISDVTKVTRSMKDIMSYGNTSAKYAEVTINKERAEQYGKVQSTYESYSEKSKEAQASRSKLAEEYKTAMTEAAEAKNQADRDIAIQRANAAKAGLDQIDQQVNQAAQDVQVQAAITESERNKQAEAISEKIMEQQLKSTLDNIRRIKESSSKVEIK